jgi:flagellar protein FliT
MTREKLFIQKDIKDLSVKKESTGKYANPYQSMATDGMFYDKRK